ncbi:DUF4038 domain-containing protein [Candidatus Poribacteria bacterium]
MLKISDNARYLVYEDGTPFFYLADTAWASFGNVPLELWEPYLRYRKMQGFNALQISILPIIHDRSVGPGLVEPFAKKENGAYDFSQRNEAYFAKAEKMVQMAVDYDFIPVLGVLWLCYAIQRNDPNLNRMSLDEVREYSTFAAGRFKKFDPIFFVSGDTPQHDDEEIDRYCVALEATKAVCPNALYTMHIAGGRVLHERLIDGVDFYMYQSGHGANGQQSAQGLAKQFQELPHKPIVNGEPCYEGHGRMGTEDRNKFSAFDVRRATWQSLLSGASMGITYGAQGIWSGQVKGMRLMAEKRKFEAYDWEFAYQLEGSWDVGFVKWVFENFKLADIEPVDLVKNDDNEIVAAADAARTKIVAYAPYTTSIEFDIDLSEYTCSCINLNDRRIWTPPVRTGSASMVELPQFNHDMLFLAIKR